MISRRARRRDRSVAAVVAVLAAVLLTGCGTGDGPERAARAFLDAWARGDAAAAAAATDDPASAGETITAVARTLPRGPGRLEVRGTGDDGTVGFDATWPVRGLAEPWRYTGRVAVARGPDGGWRVHWQPQDLHPDLGPQQSLVLDAEPSPRAALLDADGAPLTRPTETVEVGVVPARTPNLPALAAELASVLDVDAAQLVADAARARPSAAVPVITLRRADYDAVRGRIRDLAGTVFRTRIEQLGPTPGFAQPLLGRVDEPTAEQLARARPGATAATPVGTSGLQEAVDDRLAGRPAATVAVTDTAGRTLRELITVPGHPGVPVRTTISIPLQQAAERALAGTGRPAAIVAVQPSTGALRAVAATPEAPFDIALAGRYPPGSIFKIVTAAAAMESGAVDLDRIVACPASVVVAGRTIPNENRFALGDVPFRTAFARSCNTTFALLSERIGDPTIVRATSRFGIGAGWGLPVDSFDGSYRPGPDAAGTAANAFGQGTDLVSPLSAALLAATVARGSTPVPQLIDERPATAARPAEPLDPRIAMNLRSMMRDVIADGTATDLSAVPGGPVFGKTGTAEHGTGRTGGRPPGHSWFVGYQGDLAFAVFVENGQTEGAPANPVAARFLRARAR